MIHLYEPLDSPLIQTSVLLCRNRHERIWRPGPRIERRLKLPLGPAIVVFRRSQTKRCKRFRTWELLIAPFFREKTGQKCMVRLTDEQQLIALFLNDQALFPTPWTLS